MLPARFEALSAQSRELHGHRYVLPVAVWVQESGAAVITVGGALTGLSGQADRPRVIESLAKLTAIGALTELPRGVQPNAPRFFERNDHPYWDFVEAYALEVETRSPG